MLLFGNMLFPCYCLVTCHCLFNSRTRKTSPWDPTNLSLSNYRFYPTMAIYGRPRALFLIDWEERYQIAAGSLILPLGTMSSFRCTSSHSVVSDSDLCGSPFARLWTVWVEGPIVGRRYHQSGRQPSVKTNTTKHILSNASTCYCQQDHDAQWI